MRMNSIKIAALLLMGVSAERSLAQQPVVHNQYPCAECAVFDNNGNDLKGFITTNKKEVLTRGGKINEYSNNSWGYLNIRSIKVPSMDKKGNLNYWETIDVTLALYKTADGAQATWMARECNSQQGPLVYLKVDDQGKLDMENVKYTAVTHDLETKKFAIVEYYDSSYNDRDYDNLLKNYILIKSGVINDVTAFKPIIEFHDNFLSKFTYVSDPVLETKSFVTFFTANGVRYIGYFNVINNKLAGKLDAYKVEYERDRAPLVADIFGKLKGKNVYLYGDDTFGMEPEITKYARENGFKIKHKKTTSVKKFNEDK